MTNEDVAGTSGYDGAQMKVITSTDGGGRAWGEAASHWPGVFNVDSTHFLALYPRDGMGAVSYIQSLSANHFTDVGFCQLNHQHKAIRPLYPMSDPEIVRLRRENEELRREGGKERREKEAAEAREEKERLEKEELARENQPTTG
ncbi:unnamed protein product [Clonostachys rosea f. rosea IK726]|uniref:Uncharacterized protein n=1 Tax=Clonostachys rosea f. rosea IK726 TaxID=1349383 RepID=A0ACA9UGC1_BIOOC|nr:unnamed protein product [Clonostachys rosea f. rosea IK726]